MVEKKKHPIKTPKKEFLSLFGSGKTKSTAKVATTTPIENHADPETTKQITKNFVEKLIRGKVEDAITTSHSDIKDKIEKAITKLSNEFDQKVTSAINASRSNIENKIDESLKRLSSAFDQKIEATIDASRSDSENKIDESTTKLLNELKEKTKLNSDNILSNIQDEYRKQTEGLLKTAKSTTLANRMYVIGIGSAFVVVITILSLIGYSKIKSTANDTVMRTMESQANMAATKGDTETLIEEKAEGTINKLRKELNARLEERAAKIFGKLERNIELKSGRVLSDLQGEHGKQTEAPSHATKREENDTN